MPDARCTRDLVLRIFRQKRRKLLFGNCGGAVAKRTEAHTSSRLWTP
ncbi:hypothetical protein SAMN05443247_00566 [Bradyrhizobium erythrophlei]|jgi:hypothetical protein|nr:hypothetical protein SAMN05443247_00566 [Bradyrhizobium erythrophlei]